MINVQRIWKESASLIVLANNKTLKKKYGYDVLMLKRSTKTSLRQNHVVFPGGIKERTDESPLWIEYFKRFEIDHKLLKDLSHVHGHRPEIFQSTDSNSIEKEIALRITALRETFEEVGMLLCREKKNFLHKKGYGTFKEDFDKKYWQTVVHNDPSKFLVMCEELNVVPDLWGLYEWSVWLTPASDKKRFQTAFFLVALNDRPVLNCEENEVSEILWKNPNEYFESYHNSKVWFQPPQVYELSRLANIHEIENAQKFAMDRNSKGSTLFLPVKYKCNNGLVGILPGDDIYPENPNDITNILQVDENVNQFCSPVKRCHRVITGNKECRAVLNFEPFDGHLKPIDVQL